MLVAELKEEKRPQGAGNPTQILSEKEDDGLRGLATHPFANTVSGHLSKRERRA